jgi:serine/threonine protein kinase
MLPKYIGRYRIIDRLGQGGMGMVLRAEDEVRHRQVAIKLPNDTEAETIRRLQQECEVLTQLQHHHIVQVYGSGSEPDLPFYIVMEFVDGVSVSSLLNPPGTRLDPRRALKIAQGVAEALAYAHRLPQRVIHRDIKPANILLQRGTDEVKVTDFGIASILSEQSARTAAGTLAYMSPEQAAGIGADERTDLYSLGVMLYEMLTGQRPPQIASTPAIPPSGITGVALPPEMRDRVDRLVLGLLANDRNQRMPQNAKDLVEELRAIQEGRPSRLSTNKSGSMPYATTQRASAPPAGPYPSPSGSYPPPSKSAPPPPSRSNPPPSQPYQGRPSAPGYLPYPSAPPPVVVQQPVVVPQPVYIQPQPVFVQPQPVYLVPVIQESSKAGTALTLAIISIFLLGPILALPAVIVGHGALKEIRLSNGRLQGHGKAVAALVIGYIVLGISLLVCLSIFASTGSRY